MSRGTELLGIDARRRTGKVADMMLGGDHGV